LIASHLIFIFVLLASCFCAEPLHSQQVADRVIARIENEIILLSDLRTLSSYQVLVEGKSESDNQVLERLIDQWIVRTEADASRFPHPSETEVGRSLEVLRKSYGSDENFEKRLQQCGLSKEELTAELSLQLYLSNYLESRFRPMVHVDPNAVLEFYEKEIVARSKARGQEPLTLEASREAIQEALIQSAINEQADQWLKESRVRLRIEKNLEEELK
jgi:hypothetical protein